MELEHFNFSGIKKTSKIAIIGPRCCGKTTLIEELLAQNPNYTDVYRANGIYDTDANIDSCIGDVLRSDDVNTVILDDVFVGMNSWKNLQKLFFNGHYQKNLIITLQSLKFLPPSYRSNLDYIFMKDGDTFDRNRLYNYLDNTEYGLIPWSNFNDTLDNIWDNRNDRQWIVLDNTVKNGINDDNGYEDRLFYYSKKENELRKDSTNSTIPMIAMEMIPINPIDEYRVPGTIEKRKNDTDQVTSETTTDSNANTNTNASIFTLDRLWSWLNWN